ncbi:hypothetical protein ILUMI_06146 [Ignelater luminosus]|uniref:Polyprenal reductase n=1 Tax=Ignelater luminosus TaxID=2038154 RepID=A0A8K0GFP0_IGNLU|nr:hypothetical protein ILUMI_06146 [Ignelater luminosus]
MNYIQLYFSSIITVLIVLGILINKFEKYTPVYVKNLFHYGKTSTKSKHKLLIEVPKSWFKHFYVYSSLLSTFMLVLVVLKRVYSIVPFNSLVVDIFEFLSSSARFYNVSETSATLALFLYTLHSYRRFYETHFISIFGKNSKMNVLHYLSGFSNFSAAVFAILLETTIFSRNAKAIIASHWTDLEIIDIIASILFLWASWKQYRLGIILANLRKNEKGFIVTQGHKLPKGDWFDYVSSPHLLAEILIYIALTTILRKNGTWMYLFVWVICNQIECALLTHWWYQDTFKDMPKQRKAIIPFIY